MNALAAQNPQFRFRPVLSRPGPDWSARRGYVQDAAIADFDNAGDVQVYACGSPAMVADAERAFLARGLPRADFFADAFFTEAEPRLIRDRAQPDYQFVIQASNRLA
jgi:CDP-4-dehydro-6-deoxyglucose reductase